MSAATSAASPARTILLAVDKSEATERACKWTADNILRPGDELRLFHVVPYPSPLVLPESDIIAAVEPDPDVQRAESQKMAGYIKETLVPELKDGVRPKVEIVSWEGDPESVGRLLCQRATELSADALVVGSHHKGILERFLMGSTTLHCVKNSDRPVIILP